MPTVKPMVIPIVVAKSNGASDIGGTSSTAIADMTIPAARCCRDAAASTGTLTAVASRLSKNMSVAGAAASVAAL
eukprot:5711882-Pleurochrysis_carterae.AAC.2